MMATMSSFAQKSLDISQIPFNDGKITYTLIDTLTGAKKSLLQSAFVEWLAKKANNSNQVIKVNDTAKGKVIAKIVYDGTRIANGFTFAEKTTVTLEATFKDDRYRIVLSDYLMSVNQLDLSVNDQPCEVMIDNLRDINKNSKPSRGERIMALTIIDKLNRLDLFSKNLLIAIKTDIKKSINTEKDF